MLGKRFQRTISMSQIGPGSNLHTEKVQVQPHQQQLKGEQHAEYQPAHQWEILKNAEAMMMMMMANSGAADSNGESPLLRDHVHKRNEQSTLYPPVGGAAGFSAEHPIGSPSSLILSTHHFLDACFSCKRRLRPERDIFIYRGDAAFCTEECRNRQILTDETRSLRVSKKGDATSETAVAA